MRVVLTKTGIKFERTTDYLYRAEKWLTPDGEMVLIEASSIVPAARFRMIKAGFKSAGRTRKPRLSRAQRLL